MICVCDFIWIDFFLMCVQVLPKRQPVWPVMFWKHAGGERNWKRRQNEICWYPLLFLHQPLPAHAVFRNSSQVLCFQFSTLFHCTKHASDRTFSSLSEFIEKNQYPYRMTSGFEFLLAKPEFHWHLKCGYPHPCLLTDSTLTCILYLEFGSWTSY